MSLKHVAGAPDPPPALSPLSEILICASSYSSSLR